MSTVLTAGHSFADLEGLGATLAQASAGAGLVVQPVELAAVPLQQQGGSGASVVLAYLSPAVSVGRALKAAGQGPAPAVAELLANWRIASEAMLAWAVRHPARCLLVNAEAALAEPAQLVAQAQQALDLPIDPGAARSNPAATLTLSAIETLVTNAMVAADHEAAALFIELESCAHLGQAKKTGDEQLAQSAWLEFQDQHGEAAAQARAEAQLAEMQERVDALAHERDHQRKLSLSVAETLEAKESEAARQTALAQHLQREAEALLLQLHEAHLESEEYFRQADVLRAELQAAREEADAQRAHVMVQASALHQTQTTVAKLDAERLETATRLTQAQAEAEAEAERLRQLRQERDRARVQLIQINAEVLRLQEAGQRDSDLLAQAEAARQLLQNFWHHQQPDEVRINLSRDINGTNWYPPENDGRWTGPERQSTLVLPALKPGRYQLQMTLVGAMSPQIAAGLRVELNGLPLEMSFNRNKHPRVGSATFQAPLSTDGTWVLSLNVPAVESPAARGSPDQRLLGVRLADLKFTAPPKA